MPSPITRATLHSRLTADDRPIVVEALGPAFYTDAHLPGAVNIPPGQVDELAPAVLPDLDADIVVYGSGSSTSSDLVARRLEQLGYRAVLVYRGGKEEWAEHGLPLERLDRSPD
ncbi:MAG TPA: rhodanese-like domain-containing protein [Acidimicrobiales bacterium]